jgi:hypothetical protein
MTSSPLEFTFLVRLWRSEGTDAGQWRGSVHEVSTGERRFVTGTREIAEFIAARLRDDRHHEP